jgi:hypothetical protein
VCDTLVELEEALKRYAPGLDGAALSGEDAARATRAAACIEKVAASLKGLAAARAAETGVWKGRSAAAELARVTGRSVYAAAETLETARRLSALPEVAAAARRGELSEAQVSAIASAAEAEPGAESRLVELASRSSLAELRDECARVKAAATDVEARRREIHARRFLRQYTDAEGAWHLRMRDNPEVGSEIMAAIQPIRDRLFAEARAEGRREPPEAYSADALVALARTGGEGRAKGRAKVIARVDLPTLLRGYPVGGEVCELAGYGPVAVSALRHLIDTGDPFLAAVVTSGQAVLGVAHLGRRPNARQQTALEWLYPTCAVEGCGAVARLENDHRVDWSASHVTVFDLLDRLCPAHHRLKTVEGWRLVEGRGKRAFVPPDDPRHPGPVRTHAPPRWEAA